MNLDEIFPDDSRSQFVSEIGKRQEFILRVDHIRQLQMGYAVEMVKFSDLTGNQFVWWASKDSNLSCGTVYMIRATVKKHSVFREIRQTVINRIKVLGEYDEPTPLHELSEILPDTLEEIWEVL